MCTRRRTPLCPLHHHRSGVLQSPSRPSLSIPDVVLPKYQCREINAAGPYGASSQRFKAQGLTVMKLFFSEKERGPGLRVERPTLPKSMAFPSLRAICALCVCVSGQGTEPGCAPVSRSESPTGLY